MCPGLHDGEQHHVGLYLHTYCSYDTAMLFWDIDYGTVYDNVPATSPRFSEVKAWLVHKIQLMTHGICL